MVISILPRPLDELLRAPSPHHTSTHTHPATVHRTGTSLPTGGHRFSVGRRSMDPEDVDSGAFRENRERRRAADATREFFRLNLALAYTGCPCGARSSLTDVLFPSCAIGTTTMVVERYRASDSVCSSSPRRRSATTRPHWRDFARLLVDDGFVDGDHRGGLLDDSSTGSSMPVGFARCVTMLNGDFWNLLIDADGGDKLESLESSLDLSRLATRTSRMIIYASSRSSEKRPRAL